MAKIHITYEPFNAGATFVPDGLLVQWATKLVDDLRDTGKDIGVIVGTDLPITMFRVMIKEGTIDTDDVEFIYKGEVVPHLPTGKINHWPQGFCSYEMNLLSRL